MDTAGAPLNVWDYEQLAERELDEATLGYFAGGAADEHTLRDNLAAFGRWRLVPRVLVDVGSVTTETAVLGATVAMPILVAPIAYQRMVHPEGEVAVARAAAAARTIMCLSTFATAAPDEVAAAAPSGPRWFQLYWHPDRGKTKAILDAAKGAGFAAIVFTLDLPVLGRRERDLRTGFTLRPDLRPALFPSEHADEVTPASAATLVDPRLTWRDLEWLHDAAGLPVVAKGILSPEDARLAVEHGCAAVVVSNHGGRQLDRAIAALDALPAVVEAVDRRVEVLMDSGVRRGSDVAIALALGARAVFVGRPVIWGLAARGADGAQHVLELLRAELELALALLGCPTPQAVDRSRVVRAPEPASGSQ